MKVLLSSLLVMVMMAANAPLAQAQSDILESATRLASTVEAAQEGSTIRRLRSRTMAGLGAALVGVGVGLFVRPPKCGHEGAGTTTDPLGATYTYTDVYRTSGCDVEVNVRRGGLWLAAEDSVVDFFGIPVIFPDLFVEAGTHREYVSEVRAGRGVYVLKDEVQRIEITEDNSRRYTGLAIAGGGGVLLWYGLSRIEVPFRVDLTPGGGVLASRSFGW